MRNWLFIRLLFVAFSGYSYGEQPITIERQQLFKKIEGDVSLWKI